MKQVSNNAEASAEAARRAWTPPNRQPSVRDTLEGMTHTLFRASHGKASRRWVTARWKFQDRQCD